MDSFTKFTISITAILLGILMIGVGCLLYALPVYLLWNWVIPSVFSLPEITMLQSFGITLLCRFLFAPDVSRQIIKDKLKDV